MSDSGTPLGVLARVVLSADDSDAVRSVADAGKTRTADRQQHAAALMQTLMQSVSDGTAHADIVLRDDSGASFTFTDVPLSVDSSEHEQEQRVPTSVASYTAVVSMRSQMPNAERLFQILSVSLDAVPGNQLEGISPLYHVINVDEADGMAAVVQLSTHCDAQAMQRLLDTLARSHEGAVAMTLVQLQGQAEGTVVQRSEPYHDAAAATDAAVLAPWFDMDPDARLDDDPVSYLLAMAPNAGLVGMLSQNWILGETQ